MSVCECVNVFACVLLIFLIFLPQFDCMIGYDKYKESDDQWEAFATTLLPITSIFGIKEHSMGHKLNEIIVSLAEKQAETLLFGRIKGQNSPNLKKLSGIPYLSGDDTWIDFPRLFSLPLLQPDKVHFRENYHPDWVHVLPLLREMESVFTVLANNISVILKEAETKSIIQKLKRKKRKFENSIKRKSAISESVNSQNSEIVRKFEVDNNGNLVVEKPLSSNLHGFRQEANEEINDTEMTSTSSSSSTSSTSFPTSQSLILIEDNMENLMINDAGLDILRELDDCIGLLVLRVTHVRLLYESRDKPQPTSNEKTRLQKEARSILRLAREVSIGID